jgi:uncharacterized protein (TIGR03790 family)
MRAAALLLILACCVAPPSLADTTPAPVRPGLSAADLAVVINLSDPLSEAIGSYYVDARHIPATNVVRVRFDSHRDDLPVAQFAAIQKSVNEQTGKRVQAIALTWARPYRVGCMSITSAFAFGFDAKYCANGCLRTQQSPYYDSATTRPYDDLHIRPTMALAAADFDQAKALIDRGVRADRMFPRGTAYLVSTTDTARNVRAPEYPPAALAARNRIGVEIVHGTGIRDRKDVLFYFTGVTEVPELASNRFVPGAIADHLTSFGGMLTDSSQMSSLRWLEAGATGSYGTVVEPCAFPGKFPDVGIVTKRYLAGETLLEAYWKSVAMPGQGIFIGDPLTTPFRADPPL